MFLLNYCQLELVNYLKKKQITVGTNKFFKMLVIFLPSCQTEYPYLILLKFILYHLEKVVNDRLEIISMKMFLN